MLQSFIIRKVKIPWNQGSKHKSIIKSSAANSWLMFRCWTTNNYIDTFTASSNHRISQKKTFLKIHSKFFPAFNGNRKPNSQSCLRTDYFVTRLVVWQRLFNMSRKGISQDPQQLKQKTFSFAFEKHSFDFSPLPTIIPPWNVCICDKLFLKLPKMSRREFKAASIMERKHGFFLSLTTSRVSQSVETEQNLTPNR